MVCKECNTEKVKIKTEKRKSSSSYFYVNEKGKLWNGRVCPDCKYGNGKNEDMITKRKCRKCDNHLTESRYFHCYDCKPILSSDADFLNCYLG